LYINCREKDYMSSQAFAAELKLQLIAQFRSKTFRRFAFTLLDSLSEFRSFVIRLGPTQSPVGVENGSAFIQFLQHLQNPSVTALDDVLKDFVGFLRACKLCPMHIPPCLSQQWGLRLRSSGVAYSYLSACGAIEKASAANHYHWWGKSAAAMERGRNKPTQGTASIFCTHHQRSKASTCFASDLRLIFWTLAWWKYALVTASRCQSLSNLCCTAQNMHPRCACPTMSVQTELLCLRNRTPYIYCQSHWRFHRKACQGVFLHTLCAQPLRGAVAIFCFA